MTTASKVFKLPDTGQIRCYDEVGNEIDRPMPGHSLHGQNGSFIINPLSYTKMDSTSVSLPVHATWEDGYRLVLDTNTGLMWEVKSPDPEDLVYRGTEYSWQDAQDDYVKKLNTGRYCGFADWRLPARTSFDPSSTTAEPTRP